MNGSYNPETQQSARGASSSNNPPTSFPPAPPHHAPFNNSQQGYGVGEYPQNHSTVNARPPIRPPVGNPHFTSHPQSIVAPSSSQHNVQQYHHVGWGAPAPPSHTGNPSGASGVGAGIHGQWQTQQQAPNQTTPGSTPYLSSWGAVNNPSSIWSNAQPLANVYPPGRNTVMDAEGKQAFVNSRPFPPPPPPMPPLQQGNATTNYLINPSPHWSSLPGQTSMQSGTTNGTAHGMSRPSHPNVGNTNVGQYINGISYQANPFATQQSNVCQSQMYMRPPVQPPPPQQLSFQQSSAPASMHQTQTTRLGHTMPHAPFSTPAQQNQLQAVPFPPPQPQVPARHAEVGLQQKKPQPLEVSKPSKSIRKKRKRQERKKREKLKIANAVVDPFVNPPSEASGDVSSIDGKYSDTGDSERKNREKLIISYAEVDALVNPPSEENGDVSSIDGQFSDAGDSELDEQLIILEYLINRYDDSLSDGDGPETSAIRDIEICCEKIEELEKLGNHHVTTMELEEKRAELIRRAWEIIMAFRSLNDTNMVDSAGNSAEVIDKSRGDSNERSDTVSVQLIQVEPYSQTTGSVANHATAIGSAGSSRNVTSAVGNNAKAAVEASTPRGSASRALQEAKAKLRLAKLHMALAAKKKALQMAKAKSGQSIDVINALMKGGLDCFVIERIDLSGPASKVRFADTLLVDDPKDETHANHSSDMSTDDDSSNEVQRRDDDPPLDLVEENLPRFHDEPSLLQRVAELQNVILTKLKNVESVTKLQRLDKVGLTSLLRDTVDKSMEELNDIASLEATSRIVSTKESKASTRLFLKKRKEEALRSKAVAHHKIVISKQQRMLRKQLIETEQIEQSTRIIDEEVLILSNETCPELRRNIQIIEGRQHALDDMLAGYLSELMSLRKELQANKQHNQDNADVALPEL